MLAPFQACGFDLLACPKSVPYQFTCFKLRLLLLPKQALNRVFAELARRRDKPWLLEEGQRLRAQRCGFEAAVQMYLRGINRQEVLEVEWEMPRRLQRLSEEAELAIFRIIQASLTNIHLHSGSNKANVKIEHISDGLAITISDHGRGIPNGVLDRSSVGKGAGVGIVGMKERVKQLGGRLEIETSERGTQGTEVITSCHFRRAKYADRCQ